MRATEYGQILTYVVTQASRSRLKLQKSRFDPVPCSGSCQLHFCLMKILVLLRLVWAA